MIFSRPEKAPPQIKRMLVVSTCRNSCCGCLRPLRRHRRDGALHDLEQRLLHPFPGHVTGNRGIVGFARNLVDLVDINNPALGTFDVVIGGLQELQDDILDILPDIPGFGERGGIGHREGYVENARKRLRQQRLAAASRAYQKDVRFGEFDLIVLGRVAQPLIMVVNRH